MRLLTRPYLLSAEIDCKKNCAELEKFARVRPELPQGRTYRMEVIDAWNMTREVAATGFRNGDELKLPGREYMAVLATAE